MNDFNFMTSRKFSPTLCRCFHAICKRENNAKKLQGNLQLTNAQWTTFFGLMVDQL